MDGQAAGLTRSLDGQVADIKDALHQALVHANVLDLGHLNIAGGLGGDAGLVSHPIADDGGFGETAARSFYGREDQQEKRNGGEPGGSDTAGEQQVTQIQADDQDQRGDYAGFEELGCGLNCELRHSTYLSATLLYRGNYVL